MPTSSGDTAFEPLRLAPGDDPRRAIEAAGQESAGGIGQARAAACRSPSLAATQATLHNERDAPETGAR
jgi:hypothetical protein